MPQPANKVLIGRDVTVYSITGDGWDELSPTAGIGSCNLVGRWNEVKLEFSNNWSEVTPSDGEFAERRRTIGDWKASCSGKVRETVEHMFDLALNNDYVIVLFTIGDEAYRLEGGIERGSLGGGREAHEDSLDILCTHGGTTGGITKL